MDTVSPEQRSLNMSRVGRRDTAPELRVRQAAHAMGFRFRLHRRDLPGTPDIVFPRHRLAILVHGCFWHGHEGCRRAKLPGSNVAFWTSKIGRNKMRDQTVLEALTDAGWRSEVIWECETRSGAELNARLRSIFGMPNSP